LLSVGKWTELCGKGGASLILGGSILARERRGDGARFSGGKSVGEKGDSFNTLRGGTQGKPAAGKEQ